MDYSQEIQEITDRNAEEMSSDSRRPKRALQQASYFSRALQKEQPYAYFLPYAPEEGPETDASYPLLVMLHGWGGGYRDWPTYTRIARYLVGYPMIVAFPEGANGWYTNAADGSARYEDDLVEDFIEQIQTTLPVAKPGREWGISGLSMGGYGAVKLALKHPHLFSLAAGHSGAFEKMQTAQVHPVFGDPKHDAAMRRKENPLWLAEQALSADMRLRPRLYFDCGLKDGLLESNRRFDGHLSFLGYPHTYRELTGLHTWPYWDRAFRTLLPTLAAELGITHNGISGEERKERAGI